MKVKTLVLFHHGFPAHRRLREGKDSLALISCGEVSDVAGKVLAAPQPKESEGHVRAKRERERRRGRGERWRSFGDVSRLRDKQEEVESLERKMKKVKFFFPQGGKRK